MRFRLRPRNAPAARTVSPELERELEAEPRWMYDWELSPGVRAPLSFHELPGVHQTRLEMMEPAVRAALQAAGPRPTVLDLACNEGWFAHRMLDWGADRVVGLDIREQVIRRAQLVRDHFGIDAQRLSFRCQDVLLLDPATLERFDVVLLLGLVYHLENPMGAVRLARALTGQLCVIESQLTLQEEPIRHGWGVTDQWQSAPASFASLVEENTDTDALASFGRVLSLVPNRAALMQMAQVAGFASSRFAQPQPHHNPQYVRGDRAVLLCYPGSAQAN